uniref:Peptidase S1 domain-containing protein n=1 Tax=Parastrongyloides trichosuri TaxID=131310 RepID=A0A0N4ZDY8_PARTI
MLEFSVDPMSEGKQKLPRNFRFVKNYASTLPMKNFNYGNVREQMVENKLQLLIFNNEDKLELISISDDMHTPYYLTIIPKDIIIEDDYIMIPEKEVIIVDVDNLVDVYCLRRSKYSNMGSKMLVMTSNMEKIETQEDILKSLRGHIHVKYLIGNKIFCRSYTCRMSETVFFTRNITSSKKDDCYDDNIRRTVHEGHEQNVTIILIIVISLNIASVIYAVSLNYFIDTSEFEIAFKH